MGEEKNIIRAEMIGERIVMEGDEKSIATVFGSAFAEVIAKKQQRIDLFEEEARRLLMYINDLKNGQNPLCLSFDNSWLSSICDMVTAEFRPLTEEERKARMIGIKNAISQIQDQL